MESVVAMMPVMPVVGIAMMMMVAVNEWGVLRHKDSRWNNAWSNLIKTWLLNND